MFTGRTVSQIYMSTEAILSSHLILYVLNYDLYVHVYVTFQQYHPNGMRYPYAIAKIAITTASSQIKSPELKTLDF